MQYFEKQGNALIFRQDGETVRVEPWQKDSLRVRGTLLSEIEEGSIALLDPEPMEAEIELVDELKATIKNGKIQAVLELQPWGQKLRITFLNQKGEVLLSEIANGGALCLRAHDYRALKGGAYQLKVSFDSNPDEKIYGMGQYQQERMNLKGCNLELAHRNSQASIPFYVSSLGYGFLWHNAAVGEVHFGTNTTEWLARTTKQLDYWVTAGDTPAEIEEHFADAIGKVPMMPEYGLGFWQCKLRYYNQEQVLNVAREYKKRGIPLDVFVIDYYHWPRCGDYRFDEEYFPDPKAMIDELHEMGIETMVSICAKDSMGPYDYQVVSGLIKAAQENDIAFAVDVYPHYGSDVDAALKAGYDMKHGLIGPGVYASHGYERSHKDGAKNTLKLLKAYLG